MKVTSQIADGVATIELNDPPANTYSYEMMRELDEAVLAARMNPQVHVIAADFRIARAGAGKIGLPEVALGVLPGTGGTQRLARIPHSAIRIPQWIR